MQFNYTVSGQFNETAKYGLSLITSVFTSFVDGVMFVCACLSVTATFSSAD